MDIDEKIKLAIEMCKADYLLTYENKFKQLYPFTTENINGYLNLFSLDNRTLLTVGSSGDQVMNACLLGCNRVSVFDICPFSEEYFYLKKAANKVFTRGEYISFFHRKKFISDDNFNFNKYNVIREILLVDNQIACYFWDQLFMKYNNSNVIRKKLFSQDEYNEKVLENINLYLKSDDNYQLLRTRLNNLNIDFAIGNIFDYKSSNLYDNIWLSNIAAYYKINDLNNLFLKLVDNLSLNGKMLITYLYDTDMEEQYYVSSDDIHDIYNTLKILPSNIKLVSFMGISSLRVGSNKINDSVLIYKKSLQK